MKRYVYNIAICAVALISLVLTPMQALAQSGYDSYYQIESQQRRVHTEWAIGIGGTYTGITSVSTNAVKISPRYGIHAHLDMAVCIGRNFAIETEIIYEGGSIDTRMNDFERRIKTRNVDIPLLLSLRIINNRIRLSAGPIFNVMSNGEYTQNSNTMFFGGISPTWNVAAGIGIRLSRHFLIEARYIHPLSQTHNQFGGTEQNPGMEFDIQAYKVTAGVAILF